MIKKYFLLFWVLYTSQGFGQPPNVVFILADDLSWADLGCYGNAMHETPHTDILAREGIRFTQAYAPAPICSASRASILSGKSPARLHFEFVTKPDESEVPSGRLLQQPPFPRDFPLEEVTFAEALDSTYVTGFFGKWHLTQENDHYLGWGDTLGPLQQGFQVGSEERGSHPYNYKERSFGGFQQGEFPVDELTQKAIDFLSQNRDTPFVLYLSMYYVHTPVHTRCAWLYDKYRHKLGKEASENEIMYAAFVETMDQYVGQILQAVDDFGLKNNTIVFFTSDNGGTPAYTDNGILNGNKWNLYEGGVRVPLIVRWPHNIQAGSVCDVPVTGTDIFPTLLELTQSSYVLKDELDGKSFMPLLQNPKNSSWERESLSWHFPFYHPPVGYEGTTPQSSLLKDNYKIIYFYEDNRSELYNLTNDPGEMRDISHEYPEKTIELTYILKNKLKGMQARFPKPSTH